MGQKVSPIGFRLGITRDWDSRWFAPNKKVFGECLIEDQRIREYIDKKLNRMPPFAGVSRIEIERTREEVKVIIHTARPGVVIGARGSEVEKLKSELEDMTQRKINIEIQEVTNPDLDAKLVAEAIAEQLRRRVSFRRLMKQRAEAAMAAGAKGVKIILSGRLGGAEMARKETVVMGSIPLQTLQANVDYAYAVSKTTYGTIGVKVWIYKGMYGEESVDEEGRRAFGRRGRR